MKKIIGIVLIVVGLIAALIGGSLLFGIISEAAANKAMAQNISIIGGADGPTSVFLAGKIGFPIYGAIIGGVIAFVAGLILVLKIWKKK